MDDPNMVDLYFVAAAAASCKSTTNGWVWYCDHHDTHGNADTQHEAEAMAEAHARYHADEDEGEEINEECVSGTYVVLASSDGLITD